MVNSPSAEQQRQEGQETPAEQAGTTDSASPGGGTAEAHQSNNSNNSNSDANNKGVEKRWVATRFIPRTAQTALR